MSMSIYSFSSSSYSDQHTLLAEERRPTALRSQLKGNFRWSNYCALISSPTPDLATRAKSSFCWGSRRSAFGWAIDTDVLRWGDSSNEASGHGLLRSSTAAGTTRTSRSEASGRAWPRHTVCFG
ncbi:unnamed protein product [Protopolystoma xenopodis]|uniref:Uncharacterized protein n=1 Tax=Protopolystoma xenopodis TaxID=117903 RepID=A0A448WY23_9PLAT|nr:unnamed protein product [Protopolystoma xenopodis]